MKQFKIEPSNEPAMVASQADIDRTTFQGVEWDDGNVTVKRGDGQITNFVSRDGAYEKLVKPYHRQWWDLSFGGNQRDLWKPQDPWDDWPVGWGYFVWVNTQTNQPMFGYWNGTMVTVVTPVVDRIETHRYYPVDFKEFIPAEIVPKEILQTITSPQKMSSGAKVATFTADWNDFKRREPI